MEMCFEGVVLEGDLKEGVGFFFSLILSTEKTLAQHVAFPSFNSSAALHHVK